MFVVFVEKLLVLVQQGMGVVVKVMGGFVGVGFFLFKYWFDYGVVVLSYDLKVVLEDCVEGVQVYGGFGVFVVYYWFGCYFFYFCQVECFEQVDLCLVYIEFEVVD